MRRIGHLLITVACFIAFSSCTKESFNTKQLEGTWGLIQAEWREYNHYPDDYSTKIENYNPFSPSSEDDQKWVFLNIEGNQYFVKQFYWTGKSWKTDKYGQFTWIFEGNKIFEGQTEVGRFSLSSDNLTIEFGQEKALFRKMSELTE